ncbi:hypothetical protein QUF74_01455 [Candidatus Halobeggiatoa sp. HSG11]|nr:hypothetical protein [Candidatus Halobeggiatoa sp. HSG11]
MSKTTASPLIIQSPENLAESHPHIFSLAKQRAGLQILPLVIIDNPALPLIVIHK